MLRYIALLLFIALTAIPSASMAHAGSVFEQYASCHEMSAHGDEDVSKDKSSPDNPNGIAGHCIGCIGQVPNQPILDALLTPAALIFEMPKTFHVGLDRSPAIPPPQA